MTVLTFPVAKVQQGDLTLFATAIPVKTLVQDGFYNVETLDPKNPNDSGYQRLLNTARAKKLRDYLLRGQDQQDVFLPTSVLLATEKTLDFNATTNVISFDPTIIGPLSVVDGQHRLEGLKMAAEKDPRLHTFIIPVNIAINLPQLHQMCHFYIVNTTQNSVEESVGQCIVSRLTDALDVENLPSLPKWIQNVVERGETNKALKLVEFLNTAPDSPWLGRIKMANDTRHKTHSIKQQSFVKAIVNYVLVANNPLSALSDFEKEKKIFLNYWKAISSLIDDAAGTATTLYKYNGVQLFCRFSIPFFIHLQHDNRFTVEAMKDRLTGCLQNMVGDTVGVGHAHWWARGGQASGMNHGAIARVVQAMAIALHKSAMPPGTLDV